MSKPIKVLIDRNVEYYAGPRKRLNNIIMFDGGDIPEQIVKATEAELSNQAWIKEEVLKLPAIAELARSNKVNFFTTPQIQFEGFFSRAQNKQSKYYLFHGINIERVEPAIDRSYFFQSVYMEKTYGGEAHSEWYRLFLLSLSDSEAAKVSEEHPNLPSLTRTSFKNIRRFRELCEGLNNDQIRDAFHLWTAEVNGLHYFLTLDKKFINVMTRTKKIPLIATPISPSCFINDVTQ